MNLSNSIDPHTKIGSVHLKVSLVNRSLDFYQQVLGFRLASSQATRASLSPGANGDETPKTLLVLEEHPLASPVHGRTGLYHFAILVPSRFELARAVNNLVESGWPLQGFADHLVSEAVYLEDPDGNGIEIYRDRQRNEWPVTNGRIRMATDPLDLQGLMSELGDTPREAQSPWSGLHPDTVIGHIHLRVAGIPEAEAYYCGILGFDLVQRYGPMAAFVSAGGYHHHIGFNTWESAGAPPPPPDSTGLDYYSILLPDPEALSEVAGRLQRAEIPTEQTAEGLFSRDPSQNKILLTVL